MALPVEPLPDGLRVGDLRACRGTPPERRAYRGGMTRHPGRLLLASLLAGASLGMLALGAAPVSASVPHAPMPARAHGRAASGTGAAALAKSINLVPGDLPRVEKWVGAPQAKTDKVGIAAGVKAAACLDGAGAATGDPFGASGEPSGNVLADVKSLQFYPKSSALTHLPAANTEVVVVKNASDGRKDLEALGTKKGLGCMATLFSVQSAQQGAGKVRVSASFLRAPRGGSAPPVWARFVATGGNLPNKLKLYNDEAFYLQGSAEVAFSFVNLGSPFKTAWADTIISSVMARAAKLAR